MTAALELQGLAKRFGRKVAVAGVDLAIPQGSFFGVLGPNGAGKTTTLSMATGLLRPDSGRALVHGVDVWSEPLRAKRLIGSLADGVDMFDRLTGEQLVFYTGMLFGLPRRTIQDRSTELLDLLDLSEAGGTPVADYSAGMRKKVGLACALIHAPRVLVLDEPFESVDPVSAANIRDILQGFASAGGTVVVSSHSMDLVERMCDHVAIIAGGQLRAVGTLDAVRAGIHLEDRFIELVGGRRQSAGLEWLRHW